MLNVEGKEYFGIGIDNSELQKDANQSKSLLKGIGSAAEVEGARIDAAFQKIDIDEKIQKGSAKSKSSLKKIGDTAVLEGVRTDTAFRKTDIGSKIQKDAKQTESSLKGIGSAAEAEGARIDDAFKKAAISAAAFFSLQQANVFVNKIIEIRGQFQKFEAVLTNTLGSNSEAKKIMNQLNDFALSTPFNYDELVGAFVKLANQGFKPTMEEMTKLGDLASATGKSFDQLTEAIIDAQVGEMERLKEFGVRASKDGDKITFTFKEQETVVKNSASAIREYLLSLGELKGVQGANAEIAKTLVTQVSNLQGAIMNMYNEIGQQTEGVLSDAISGVNYLVKHYEEVGKILGVLIASYGAYRAALIATVAAQRAAALASNLSVWFQLTRNINSAKDAQLLFNLATKANPWAMAATAIVALGTAMWAFGKKAKTAADYVKEFNDEVDRQKKEYADNLDVLVDENAAIADRQKALNVLRTIQPDIYENMTLEEAAAINLTKATRELNKAYDEQNKKKLEEWQDTYKQQIGFKTTAKKNALDRSDFQSARKIQKEIDDYNEKLKIVEGKLASVNDTLLETQNLEAQAAKEAKQKADEEIVTLEKLKKKKKEISAEQEKATSKEEYDKLELQKKSIQKQIEAITGKAKESLSAEKELAKNIKELNQKVLESELALQAACIEAMQDGKTKRVLLAEQEYRERVAAIDKEERDYISASKKAGKDPDQNILSSFGEKKGFAKDKRNLEIAEIDKEYTQEYRERYKTLTDVFLSEEQRKLSAVKERYDKERKWADEQLKTGGISREEHKVFTTTIDSAQTQESYNTLLSNLNDYKQQEKDLRDKWDTDINAAVEAKDAYLVGRLMKGKEKALSALNAQMLQESEEWQQLFGDLDNLTVSQIDNLISVIESKAKDLNLNPVDLKEVTNSLNQAKQKVIEINPFGSLGKSFKAVFSSSSEDSKKSTDEIKKDWKNLAKSTEGCFDFVNDAVASCGVLGDILGETGQQIIGMVQGVTTAGIAMAAAIKTAETASVVLAAISLALTAVTALFSVFNGDKKKEKEIKRLQDQVDALGKSYDRLGRSIEKAYSHDASLLIEQQNKNLQQQNAVIRKQIEAERSKKKSDKNKIKEWQNTIDQNNQIIEANKEKAVDAIFGSDVQSAIDDFATAYLDAWGAGEDRIKSQKDVVKNMIKGVVAEMLKSDIAPTVAKLREKIQKALADNIISDSEQAEIDALVEAATQRADSKYASLDKYLKDEKEDEKRTAQAQGIATASQESVDKNNGLLANIQYHVAKGLGLFETIVAKQLDKEEKSNPLLSVTIGISESVKLLVSHSSMILKILNGIESNTASCKKLDTIDKNLGSIKSGIETIQSTGVRIKTP